MGLLTVRFSAFMFGSDHGDVHAWCIFNAIADAPAPADDLPNQPVVRPSDYPEWGEVPVPPAMVSCNLADVPEVRYAGSTK